MQNNTDDWLDKVLGNVYEEALQSIRDYRDHKEPKPRKLTVMEASQVITQRIEEAEAQGAINAIYRFKAERVNHTLTTAANEWEREFETADRALATYLAELKQLASKPASEGESK